MARQRGHRFWPQSGTFRTSILVFLILTLLVGISPVLPLPGTAGIPTAQDVAAKNNSKHKRKDVAAAAQSSACQFKKSGATWKLQASCTITSPINIPNGVTLDGNGKTITMTGPVANYHQRVPDNWTVDAGVLANGGQANVRDLKLKGSGLTGTCPNPFVFPPVPGDLPEGIAFINTTGTIEQVSVADVRLDGARSCGAGISATGTGGQRVAIRDVAVSGSASQALWGLSRDGTAGISVDIAKANVTVGSGSGVSFSGPVSGALSDVAIATRAPATTGIVLGLGGSGVPRRITLHDVDVSGPGRTPMFAVGNPGAPLVIDIDESSFATDADPLLFDSFGMFLNGRFTLNLKDSVVRGATFGVYFEGIGANGSIQDSTIEGSFLGIEAAFRSQVTVEDSTIENVQWGASANEGSTLNVLDTRVTGNGPGPDQSIGLYFDTGSGGRIDDTAIANFFDTNPDTVSCGIGLLDAGVVDIDDVSYPPPGNEQDFCDPVSFGFAASARVAGSKTDLDRFWATAMAAANASPDPSADGHAAQGSAASGSDAGKDRMHRERSRDKRGGKHRRH